MLGKVLNRFNNKIGRFSFSSVPTEKKAETTSIKQQQQSTVQSSVNPEQRYKTPDFSKFAYVEYKKFPDHLAHFNRSSPEYIASFRDDFVANHKTNSYNYYIRRIKEDLTMQKRVHEILRKMDRPYLRGTPGNTRNISGGLQDYVELKGVERNLDDADQASQFLAETQRNEDRWMNQTLFYPKYSKMTHYDVEWQKELDARPVTADFHPDKGYKYDVEVPYEQRYDYLADRLGHPEILGTPAERLLRLEGEIYHPNFLDQPFVKIPSASPHPSLNFEEGEIVYENTRLLEWAKFWNYSTIFGLVWSAVFVPYQLLFKTHMPLEYAYDNLFIPYFQRSMFFWDNNALHVPIVSGSLLYACYITISYLNNIWGDYVVKAQYSKDRELLFVTRVSPYGSTEEEVYEMAHIEILPPSVKSAVNLLSSQDEDGIYDASCLNTQRSLLFYGDAKYWNPAERKNFFDRTMNLFTADYIDSGKKNDEEMFQGVFPDTQQPKLEAKK